MKKVSVGICEMSVNDAHLEWDEDKKRRAKPCEECKNPTKGLAIINAPLVSIMNMPYCIGCAINKVTTLGIAPVSTFLKLLGGNRAR